MPDLPQVVRDFVERQPHAVKRILVAFSGGLDSSVLLHALQAAALPQPVMAVYINHGLSSNADAWQAHCAQMAQLLGVDYCAQRVDVQSRGKGLEQAAREARYSALSQLVGEGDLVLTGHHRQDQAETFLLRLARGSGWRGLRAMAPTRALGAGLLGRPLLAVDRADLLAYAQALDLHWIEDESNQLETFDRNFLRHQLLPLLSQRWSNFSGNVARCADLLGEAGDLLDDYGRADLKRLQPRPERLGDSIEWLELQAMPVARRNHVVRTWLAELGYQPPSRRQLAELDSLLQAKQERMPRLLLGSCDVRRFKNRLYALPAAALERDIRQAAPLMVVPSQATPLADGSVLDARLSASGLRVDREYRIQFRSQPLRVRPQGRAHSQSLKKVLQEYQVEPWLRDRVPLLFHGDRLAAVGDLWVEADYWTNDEALTLNWYYPPLS